MTLARNPAVRNGLVLPRFAPQRQPQRERQPAAMTRRCRNCAPPV